jgi:hypothetical protein
MMLGQTDKGSVLLCIIDVEMMPNNCTKMSPQRLNILPIVTGDARPSCSMEAGA